MGPRGEVALVTEEIALVPAQPVKIKAETSDDEYEQIQNEAGMPQRRRQRKPSKLQQPDEAGGSPTAKRHCSKAGPDAAEPAAAEVKTEQEGGSSSYGLRRRSTLHAAGDAGAAGPYASGMQAQLAAAGHRGGSAALAAAASRWSKPPVTINDVRGLLISHCGRSVSESTMPVIKMLSRVAGGSIDLKLLFSRDIFLQLLQQMNHPSGSSFNLKPMSKYTYMSALVRVLDLPSVQRMFSSEADQQQLQVLRADIAEAKKEFMKAAAGARRKAPAASGGKHQKQQQQQLDEQQQEAAQKQQQQQYQLQGSMFWPATPLTVAEQQAAVAAMAMALQQLDPAVAAAAIAAATAAPDAAAAAAAPVNVAADAAAATSSDGPGALGNADAAAGGTTSDDGSKLRRSRRQQLQLVEADMVLSQQMQDEKQQGIQEEETIPAPVALCTVEDLKQLLTSIKGADKVSQQSVATLLSPIKSWSAACGGCTDLRTLFLGSAGTGSGRSGSRAKGGFDGMLQLLQTRVAKDELSPATAAMHMYSLLSVLQLEAVQEQLFPSHSEWQQMRARVDIAKKYFLEMDKAAKAAAAAAEEQYVQWQKQEKHRKARRKKSSRSSHLAAAAGAAAAAEQQHWEWPDSAAVMAAAPAAAAAAAGVAADSEESTDEKAAAALASLAAADAQAAAASAATQQQLEIQLSAGDWQQELQQQELMNRESCKASAGPMALWQQQPKQQQQQQQQQRHRCVLMLGDDPICQTAAGDAQQAAAIITAAGEGTTVAATNGLCLPSNSSADAAHSGSSNSAMPETAAAAAATPEASTAAVLAADGSGGSVSGILLDEAEGMLMQLICQLQPDASLRCALLQRLDAAMLLLRGLVATAAAAAAGGAGDAQSAAAAVAVLHSFRTDYMRVVIWRDNGMAAASVLGAVDRLMDNTLQQNQEQQQEA